MADVIEMAPNRTQTADAMTVDVPGAAPSPPEATPPVAPPPVAVPPALSEVQALKADRWTLKVQVAQLQVTVADLQRQLMERTLNDERRALETDFRVTLAPADGTDWDWQARRFVAPPKKG